MTKGILRTLVLALQPGHLVTRQSTWGLSTNEYLGGNAPMRTFWRLRGDVMAKVGLTPVHLTEFVLGHTREANSQAWTSACNFTGTICATRSMTFLFWAAFFRSYSACKRIQNSGVLPSRRETFRHMIADRGFRSAKMS